MSSLSKVILVLGKARSHRGQIRAAGGLSHLGVLVFPPKTAQDVRHERVRCHDEAASHQLPIAVAFWIVQIVFPGGMFKLNRKFDADWLLYSLSHFECPGHTVHMHTQRHLLPPLTSAVKSSSFTHVHSSPLSLAARLHRCCANCSHCIDTGWAFPGQTSYKYMIHICAVFFLA